jgi:chemotaxis protein CheX
MADRREDESDERLTEQIDVIVADVFHMMLQMDCGAMVDPPLVPMDVSAKVELSGTIDAQCVIEFPTETARKLTIAFMGREDAWEDVIVDDVLGELCNMIAGGWKSQMKGSDSASRLSLPIITRGAERHTLDAATLELRRAYALDDSVFRINLAIL